MREAICLTTPTKNGGVNELRSYAEMAINARNAGDTVAYEKRRKFIT